jgi:hypothetical protein
MYKVGVDSNNADKEEEEAGAVQVEEPPVFNKAGVWCRAPVGFPWFADVLTQLGFSRGSDTAQVIMEWDAEELAAAGEGQAATGASAALPPCARL